MTIEISTYTRASDQIEQELISKIISLELQPGEMINEADLARQFQCGRTPLREALQRLAAAHLVVNIPRRGSFIAELKLLDYVQLTDSVSLLDSGVAGLAAEKCKPEDIARLKEILRQSADALGKGEYLQAALLDMQFHNAIAEITQNKYLIETTAILHRLICRFNYVALSRGMAGDVSQQDHTDILLALQNKDKQAAEKLISGHMTGARERIMRAL
jgi:DNA-binding GntR family transcriptional regulator